MNLLKKYNNLDYSNIKLNNEISGLKMSSSKSKNKSTNLESINNKPLLLDKASRVIEEFINKNISLYDGLKKKNLILKKNMLLHKAGEFILTKRKTSLIHKKKRK